MIATRNVRQSRRWSVAAVSLLLVVTSQLSGCSRPDTLETLKAEGVLHVITRNAPTIYYEDQDGPTGYDYELAHRFAEHLGVELRVRLVPGNADILQVLDRGYAHIGFTGLAINEEWDGRFQTIGNGLTSESIVIYHRDLSRPADFQALTETATTLHVAGDSNHIRHLQAQSVSETLPEIEVHPGLDAAGVLERVEDGRFTAAVIDANELALNHVYFPNVMRAFSMAREEDIAWLFPVRHDDSLVLAAQAFLDELRDNGTLAQIRERFYGHLDRLNYVGARTFDLHVEERLPEFKPFFQQFGDEFGVDWRLLAAIGYQESNWRPDAVSPTGVRGLMMLTLNTAKYIGVDNRLDPVESISGGARYFRRVHARISDQVPEPDRTWFALASYNVGSGHLEDARQLTKNAGRDPDRWMDVKEFLPLLSQKEWYSQTRFGYARGNEPVTYVQNIRRYYDVLARLHELSPEAGTLLALDESLDLMDDELDSHLPGDGLPATEMTLVLPREMGAPPPTL